MYRVIILSAIFAINGCKSPKPCLSPFSERIVSLIEDQAKFSEFNKEKQIDNKTKIVNNLCSHFKNKERILIVDIPLSGAKGFYGAVFFYNSDLIFSYKQEENKFRIKKGYDFDKNRNLERVILAVKDSTIQKLSTMESLKSRLSDAKPINIFYLDDSNKIFKLSILVGNQILPIRKSDK
ncbi:MAG: hypothetical protein WDO16_26070 [Bacteroidota bacterium]